MQLGKEECESERASVARTQRVSEARSVERGVGIAEVHGRVVDENLVGRARDAAGIAVLGACDAKARIEIVEKLVDGLLVTADDRFRVFVKLLTNSRLVFLNRSLC